eukprot:1158542-Pelagomonas_calceolata.AAC.5
MSICQLGGGREAGVVFGPRDSRTMHPDIDWLRSTMGQPNPPKVVALASPCNPTGEQQRASVVAVPPHP